MYKMRAPALLWLLSQHSCPTMALVPEIGLPSGDRRCLLWNGHGCGSIWDQHSCVRSRDGHPWDMADGRAVHGEPCVWCGGEQCEKNKPFLCAPYGFLKGEAGSQVDTKVAEAVYDIGQCFPGQGINVTTLSVVMVTGSPSRENLRTFVPLNGGEDRACRGKSEADTGFEPAVPWFGQGRAYETWTAKTLEACESLCDFCQAIEYHAEWMECRIWHQPVTHTVNATGYQCYTVTGKLSAEEAFGAAALTAPSEKEMSCLTPWKNGCNSIVNKLTCLSSQDDGPTTTSYGWKVHGQACVWCGNGPCTSNSGSQCQAYDYLLHGEGTAFEVLTGRDQLHVARCSLAQTPHEDLTCLAAASTGCNKIRDSATCLSSKDGRSYASVAGLKVRGEPCVWCGGGPCSTNNPNLCEPHDYAVHGQTHAFRNFLAKSTFKVAVCVNGQATSKDVAREDGVAAAVSEAQEAAITTGEAAGAAAQAAGKTPNQQAAAAGAAATAAASAAGLDPEQQTTDGVWAAASAAAAAGLTPEESAAAAAQASATGFRIFGAGETPEEAGAATAKATAAAGMTPEQQVAAAAAAAFAAATDEGTTPVQQAEAAAAAAAAAASAAAAIEGMTPEQRIEAAAKAASTATAAAGMTPEQQAAAAGDAASRAAAAAGMIAEQQAKTAAAAASTAAANQGMTPEQQAKAAAAAASTAGAAAGMTPEQQAAAAAAGASTAAAAAGMTPEQQNAAADSATISITGITGDNGPAEDLSSDSSKADGATSAGQGGTENGEGAFPWWAVLLAVIAGLLICAVSIWVACMKLEGGKGERSTRKVEVDKSAQDEDTEMKAPLVGATTEIKAPIVFNSRAVIHTTAPPVRTVMVPPRAVMAPPRTGGAGDLFAQIDGNHNGTIDRREWGAHVRFTAMDRNHDGVIGAEEWRQGPRPDVPSAELFSQPSRQ
ncbi:unnamed protein product [Polarella glacialis]|uniref:EF-hand domain-containing protein n=1 Tax=Polarella glacialis TaxID=89957 RepID=A0A813EDN5_POLGL|nr:unnamed protein product [Polarella glacialis]